MASMNLISMSAPTGFWPAILNFFKGANGTYILAVILVAIVVRFLFSFVDIINKRANMKNSAITEKMQPEIDAIQKKYADDKTLMQQKTNDVYKKYQYNMMGSCLPMLVVMVLQLVVFFTLWSSLQTVSNFNITSQYQEMKEIYANVLALNENDLILQQTFSDTDSLVVEITENEEGEKVLCVRIVDDVGGEVSLGNFSWQENLSNENIITLIDSYVIQNEDSTDDEELNQESITEQTALQKAIQTAAEQAASEYYVDSLEGFLWIKNVYESDTNTSPLFSEDDVISLMSSYYDENDGGENAEEYERTIYSCVVAGVDTDALGSNGYYILPILAMLFSLLSIWLNNFLTRRKRQQKQKQSWMMYVLMPLIYGIFTFSYTSLFSIYLIVGQLMMIIMTPLTTWIVRKWIQHDDNKKKEKDVIEVDYRRKD